MKLLRSTLKGLPRTMPVIKHQAAGQVVQRLTGRTLTAMRKRLWARSGQRCECEQCQASGHPLALTWTTFEVDHIVPIFEGGTHAISNLRALHIDCHARITAQQKAERDQGSAWTDHME